MADDVQLGQQRAPDSCVTYVMDGDEVPKTALFARALPKKKKKIVPSPSSVPPSLGHPTQGRQLEMEPHMTLQQREIPFELFFYTEATCINTIEPETGALPASLLAEGFGRLLHNQLLCQAGEGLRKRGCKVSFDLILGVVKEGVLGCIRGRGSRKQRVVGLPEHSLEVHRCHLN